LDIIMSHCNMTASPTVHHEVFDMDGMVDQPPFDMDDDYGFFEDIDADNDSAALVSDENSALRDFVCGTRIKDEDPESLVASPPIINQYMADIIVDKGLPWAMQDTRLERLFASSRDGQSFGTFMRRVRGHKQTIIVAKTSDGRVVGGYATDIWSGRKQPTGTQDDSSHAFLFVVLEQPTNKTNAMLEAGATFLPGLGELGTSPTSALDFEFCQLSMAATKHLDGKPSVDIFKPPQKHHTSAGGLKQACQVGNKFISMTDANGDLSLVIESSFCRGVLCLGEAREEFSVLEFEVYGFSED